MCWRGNICGGVDATQLGGSLHTARGVDATQLPIEEPNLIRTKSIEPDVCASHQESSPPVGLSASGAEGPETVSVPMNTKITQSSEVSGKNLTPAQKANSFFQQCSEQNGDEYVKTLLYLEHLGHTRNEAVFQLERFFLYWTEPSNNGKKQRWQMEKTFEVGRRLMTWATRTK